MGVQLNLNDIQSGFLSNAAYNANNALIEQAVSNALDRTSNTDNAMEVDFNMGLNNIFNLKAAVLSHQAVPLQQVRDILSASSTEVTSLVEIEDRIIADGGETAITLENIVYTPATNSLMVFKNGEYQRAGFEYTETGTTEITFAVALTTGDEVDIFGSRYDAQQYVNLAITAANNAEESEGEAEQSATDAAASASAAQAAAGYKLDVNDQTGVEYTLALTDAGDFIRMDNASANKVIVPLQSSVNFDIGTIILVRQTGAGTTEVEPQIGVTVNSPFANLTVSDQDFGVALIKVAADEWDLVKAFGGADTAELAEFSEEFDARLQEFYTELLSADPTFVVNFDQLNNSFDQLEADFNTLETNVNSTVSGIQSSFNDISGEFDQIETDFTTINGNFITIQNEFDGIETDFTTIQNDFTTIQSDFTDIETRFTDIEDTIETLTLDGTFDNSLTTNGFQKIPNGLEMKWGYSSGGTSITFPTPFDNACFNVQLTQAADGGQSDNWVGGVSAQGFFAAAMSGNPFYWFAVGY